MKTGRTVKPVESLTALWDMLLPKLMRGEVRVKSTHKTVA